MAVRFVKNRRQSSHIISNASATDRRLYMGHVGFWGIQLRGLPLRAFSRRFPFRSCACSALFHTTQSRFHSFCNLVHWIFGKSIEEARICAGYKGSDRIDCSPRRVCYRVVRVKIPRVQEKHGAVWGKLHSYRGTS